ncbi:MarR family transcriptional regulator [Metabacillus fastidiosus]|uniref:MarR family transcriptional regulator n=1 Tax=Metabacillus fastidiosus TaxID=1458 RepID=A0ABU6NX44_9BACI|nr:MarR family transcriptional regulator [Metabacillus fastidiosus]MED4400421.1 MarR family transcriptional regulator [Metabacillus fastidiosus]MED4454138.1 MarR family transcriptional regulator [Metabacillus fastidiosus]MED4464305.1 MarR family transcriptional regulator [Metabacillus fastidiosus]
MEKQRDELISDVTQSFFEIGRTINQLLFQSEQFQLTPAQFFILNQLNKRKEMTVSHVGELLGLTSGATTIAINRLEEAKLVYRVRNANDRRVVMLQLTEEGHKLLQLCLEERNKVATKVFEQFSTDEISDLRVMLLKVRKSAKKEICE